MSHTLLAIYAHPDDEAFGSGGTLARCAAEGKTVKLICATRGESGKITDPSIDANVDKGALREQELKDSCTALGIEPPIFLDYQDSGRYERTQTQNDRALMNVSEDEIEHKLLAHIAEIKPDVILSFDPHGVYGHIDHIKIHRAATAAFWSAGGVMQPAPRRLFYNVVSSERMRMMQEIRENSPMSNLDADLYGLSEDSFAVRVNVSAYSEQKQASVQAHRSQVGPQSSFAGIVEEAWNEMFLKESFSLGGLRGSFPEMPVEDFFAGM